MYEETSEEHNAHEGETLADRAGRRASDILLKSLMRRIKLLIWLVPLIIAVLVWLGMVWVGPGGRLSRLEVKVAAQDTILERLLENNNALLYMQCRSSRDSPTVVRPEYVIAARLRCRYIYELYGDQW